MRSVIGVCASIVLAGCGGTGATQSSGADASAISRPTLSSIAGLDPVLSPIVRASALARDGAVVRSVGTQHGDLRIEVASDGAAKIGTDDDHAVHVALEGARSDAHLVLEEGRAVAEGALPATDLVFAATPGRVEILLFLREPSAPTRFSFAFSRPSDLPRAIGDGHGGLTLADARGRARLHLPAPWAVDANGVRRAATMTLVGDRLEVSLDANGLAFPVLLDPGFETQRWENPFRYDSEGGLHPFPLDRVYGTLSFDTARKQLLAFGGESRPGDNRYRLGNPTGSLSAYTVADYTDWVALAAAPDGWMQSAATSSSDLRTHAWSAAFDVDRKKLVAVGSADTAETRLLVYEWDSATNAWTERCVGGCPNQPTALDTPGPLVVYDEVRKVTVVMPRSGAAISLWNGATGAWASGVGVGSALAGATWDSKKGRVLATSSTGTWEWNGTTWTKVASVGYAPLAFDRARGRAVAVATVSPTTKTYEWDGTSWFLTADGTTGITVPPTSTNSAMGFDAARGRILLWGGGTGQTSQYSYDFKSAVWEYQSWAGTCASDADCDGGSCRDGYCCNVKCGACQTCGVSGSIGQCKPWAGAAGTGTEHDTCVGTNACNSAGACTKKIGQACVNGAECTSGNCVDGFCCNTACSGNCEVCNATPGTCTVAPKGTGGRSGCGVALCDGVSSSCPTTCASDADCSSGGYCNGTQCVSTLGVGVACTRDRMCAGGSCRDGFCCDKACNGACEACSVTKGATANGTCTSLPASAAPAACLGYKCSGTSGACTSSCTSDAGCAAGFFCDGAFCQPARKSGQTCTRTAQCESGQTCADGVCCNSACDGTCQACAAEHKQSGDASGVCGPAKIGTDPGDKCPTTAVTGCGTTGVCSATGTCALWPAGAACGPAGASVCDGSTAKGQTCDGLGTCKTDASGIACAPGVCKDGGCVLSCATDEGCDATGFCDGGTCRDKSAPGSKCGTDKECLSGFCTDGVCCASKCNGVCEACDGAGTAGTCTASTGKPHAGHGDCPTATDPCAAAVCDGIDRLSCKGLAGSSVKCREGSCAGDVETLETVCDGSGKCPEPTTRACEPFACGDVKCKDACTADTDCKRGAKCDLGTRKCFVPTSCDGDHTLKGADGRSTDCSPFRCDDKGCKTSCESSADCTGDALCDSGKCAARPPAEVDDSGGCAYGGGTESTAGFAFALLLLGALSRKVGGRR